MCKFKKSLILVLAFVSFTIGCKADALWVGESRTYSVSFMGVFHTNVSWTVSGGYISLTGGTTGSRTATVTQYFGGSATITCSYQYKLTSNGSLQSTSQSWTITCNNNPLTISASHIDLNVGQSTTLGVGLTYSNSYSGSASYTFNTSDPSVATVNSYGLITAVGSGVTNISVYCNASANPCYCVVTVTQPATSVAIPQSLNVSLGGTQTIVPTPYPSNAVATYTWSSSNNSVATVSSNGVVTGVGIGNANVHCTTNNGVVSNNCRVTVDYCQPTSIDIVEDSCFLLVGDTHTLYCNIFPTNADPALSWNTSNELIANVYGNGLVYGVQLGAAEIVATSSNGISDTCVVEVRKEATGVKIKKDVSLLLGQEYKYHISYIPTDGYANDLMWESTNNSVVTVNNGLIKAVGYGHAMVKVRNSHGLYSESRVYVKQMSHVNVWLKSGEKHSYPISYSPQITYAGTGEVKIVAAYLVATYNTAEISRITLADDAETFFDEHEAIVLPDGITPELMISHNTMYISNLNPNTVLRIYSIDGRMMLNKQVPTSDITVDMNKYNPGIYIVSINNKSFKIIIP